MPKVTLRKKREPGERETIQAKTKTVGVKAKNKPMAWWNAGNKKDLVQQLISTAMYLKEQDLYRYRKASIYAHMYGNMPIYGGAGMNLQRISIQKELPINRPTMSLVTSITDTIVSRLEMNKPRPMFVTDMGDWRQRKLGREMNTFIGGELYQTGYYDLRPKLWRDALVWGTLCGKVLETTDKRVGIERRLSTQLLVDANEAFLGKPRQMYELTLIDRALLAHEFPKAKDIVKKCENSYPEQSAESMDASDLIMVIEGWRLPSRPATASTPASDDGMHALVCVEGLLDDESWEKKNFPFFFAHYSPPQVGFWGQGVTERQLGNQASINGLLMQTHEAIRLVGVPRIFVESGSKVNSDHMNNEVGHIIEYEGTKPSYEVAPCMPAEVYNEIQNIINRGYQEEGVSQMAAQSIKPQGLDSGEAIRSYDDIQQDRLSTLGKADEKLVVEVAYLIIDKAMDIAKRDKKYQTIYPDQKNGAQTIDLPQAKQLDNPFVIQCYDTSSLPRDPAGRFAKIQEWVQAGMYTVQEGRRLLGLPDTLQQDTLLNAAEERILYQLDKIVEDGKFLPPDSFNDLQSAQVIAVQYINLYDTLGLEEKRMDLLRRYHLQVLDLQGMMSAGAQPPMGEPQAAPEPTPTNPLIPNVPGQTPGQG